MIVVVTMYVSHINPSVTSALEMVQKELAAHKEMVAELRGQLTEKEFEFQVSFLLLSLILSTNKQTNTLQHI